MTSEQNIICWNHYIRQHGIQSKNWEMHGLDRPGFSSEPCNVQAVWTLKLTGFSESLFSTNVEYHRPNSECKYFQTNHQVCSANKWQGQTYKKHVALLQVLKRDLWYISTKCSLETLYRPWLKQSMAGGGLCVNWGHLTADCALY